MVSLGLLFVVATSIWFFAVKMERLTWCEVSGITEFEGRHTDDIKIKKEDGVTKLFVKCE